MHVCMGEFLRKKNVKHEQTHAKSKQKNVLLDYISRTLLMVIDHDLFIYF